MLYPSEEGVTREAAARLATLADHTELGSGFRIAMRDLELRGAGDLLGAEQSGHVAAIGFELYVEMLDQAVAELRAAGDGERLEEEVRVDIDVSAFVPSAYVPYEAAKIDVHRRIAAARAPGELRALRDELRDRFGPPPEPVEALLTVQRAKIELAREGARSMQLRGSRILAEPLELDSERVGRLRERIPGAIFSSRENTLTVRIEDAEDGDEARIAALDALADAVSHSREPEPAVA
jgi:transcription-repair coupling factor (superfamily II helicase)